MSDIQQQERGRARGRVRSDGKLQSTYNKVTIQKQRPVSTSFGRGYTQYSLSFGRGKGTPQLRQNLGRGYLSLHAFGRGYTPVE